jgi:hypothetical protein
MRPLTIDTVDLFFDAGRQDVHVCRSFRKGAASLASPLRQVQMGDSATDPKKESLRAR